MLGGQSVLKIAAIVFMCFTVPSYAAEKVENKGIFYSAIFTMSHDEAVYIFMQDQLMEMRCGKSQSIEALKKLSTNRIYVLRALKEGKEEEAKKYINSMQCER